MTYKKFWSFNKHRRLGYLSYGDPEKDYTLYRHETGYSIHQGVKLIAISDHWREIKAIFLELTHR